MVLLPFLFFAVLIWISFFVFPFLSKKDPQKNRTQQKPQKTKMQKKTDKKKNQLAQLCSQIVFFNFLGWAYKFHCLAESTIKIVVSALFLRKKGRKVTKLLSWKSVQGCVENLSNYVAQQNWTDFQRIFLFSFIFWKKKETRSPCRKKKILEKNKNTKKEEFLDRFSTQKRAISGRIFNSTACIYIYIYIYATLKGSWYACFKGYFLESFKNDLRKRKNIWG